jgi:hypothetical protein
MHDLFTAYSRFRDKWRANGTDHSVGTVEDPVNFFFFKTVWEHDGTEYQREVDDFSAEYRPS